MYELYESLNRIIQPIDTILNYFTNLTAEIWTCILLIIIALYITITEIIKYSGYDDNKKKINEVRKTYEQIINH